MNMTHTEDKYLIVGAGPTGLACARAFLNHNIPFYGVELSNNVGGLWDINNPTSTMYKSAHLISSVTKTEFEEFPMTTSKADYPHHTEVFQYLNNYADHFNLKSYYLFEVEVVKIERHKDLWNICLSNGEKHLFKGVILCSGILSEPNKPILKGHFKGELLHSAEYKDPSIFKNKNVLIVGGGNSGCDIAVDAVHSAKKVFWSVRRGYHFLPKYVLGVPLDTLGKSWMPTVLKNKISELIARVFIGNTTRFGLQRPKHKLFEVHPILNSLIIHHLGHGDIIPKKNIKEMSNDLVHFENDKSEEIDLIILCTGYKIHYPFIDKSHLNWSGLTPKLYLNIFHPTHDDLFILGMVEAAGLGWQGKYEQGMLVAKFLKAKQANNKVFKQFSEEKNRMKQDLTGNIKYLKLDRMAYYVNKEVYRKTVNKWIKEFEKST